MSDPNKHHYLPAFYLSKWSDPASKQVVEFSRPYGNTVKTRDRHPNGAGYLTGLYTGHSLPEGERNRLEARFLSSVDGVASLALNRMLAGEGIDTWPSSQRSEWVTFLMTLLLRMPWDFQVLRETVLADFSDVEPEISDEALLLVAQELMTHKGIGQLIFDMSWSVLAIEGPDNELLTSDWPVMMTTTLTEQDAFIVLPISPEKVFVAGKERSTIERMRNNGAENVYAAVNRSTVRHARNYVYGKSRLHQAFVEAEMSAVPYTSLMERFADFRSADVT